MAPAAGHHQTGHGHCGQVSARKPDAYRHAFEHVCGPVPRACIRPRGQHGGALSRHHLAERRVAGLHRKHTADLPQVRPPLVVRAQSSSPIVASSNTPMLATASPSHQRAAAKGDRRGGREPEQVVPAQPARLHQTHHRVGLDLQVIKGPRRRCQTSTHFNSITGELPRLAATLFVGPLRTSHFRRSDP
jgi:hypothetical protein